MDRGANSVLVMAGGTGGHVFPALAVAAELRARGHGVEWLGTGAGIEAELVPARDIHLHCIQVSGVRGKGPVAKALAPFRILRALWQALGVVRRVRPSVVLGFGGFASGPGGIAARMLGIPLVIHEQNAVAGTTNRILAKVATRVAEAFPGTLAGARHTGNPVRAEIAALPAPATRRVGSHRPARLLVLGGSLGAAAVNERVPAALALLSAAERPEVRHQCGRKHLDATTGAYRAAGVEARVEPFIADMAEAYGWADFVLCRAGALTVAELTAAGVGALLVPFPAAIDDHQTRNGEWLVDNGAALLMPQRALTPEHLAALLAELLGDGDRLLTMADRARALARTTAASDVAALCEDLMAGGATA